MKFGRRKNITIDRILNAVEELDSGFAIYSVNKELEYANRAAISSWPTFYEMLAQGYSQREAIEAETRLQYPDASKQEFEEIVDYSEKAFSSEKAVELSTQDGRVIQVYHAPMGEAGIVGVSVDVTLLRLRERDLKKARFEAEAASKSKSEFLASMSHEIRTPLNAVLGMAQSLASDDLTPDQQERVSLILESGRNLMIILNDVLDLSKIEAGKLEITPTIGDLSLLLSQTTQLFDHNAREKGLALNLHIDDHLFLPLLFDTVRVRQCIANLISNAVKFTETGHIDVRADIEEQNDGMQEITLTVSDTGIGVTRETINTLFTEFTQADSSTTRRYGGTGLGLAITRKLARFMGGNVSVQSEVGMGSTFTLKFLAEPALPTAQPDSDAEQETKPANARLAGLRTLLVDDNKSNRQVGRLLLEPHGPVVTDVTNGKEALEKLNQESFDIVLLDVHMPVMDGPEAIRHIRASGEAWANIPVIALTADAMSGDREKYLAMGMNGYTSKPIDARSLFAEIIRVLDRQEQQAQTPNRQAS